MRSGAAGESCRQPRREPSRSRPSSSRRRRLPASHDGLHCRFLPRGILAGRSAEGGVVLDGIGMEVGIEPVFLHDRVRRDERKSQDRPNDAIQNAADYDREQDRERGNAEAVSIESRRQNVRFEEMVNEVEGSPEESSRLRVSCRGRTKTRWPLLSRSRAWGSVRNPIQEVTSTRLPEGCREWHRAYSSLNPQKGKSSMYSPTLPGLFSLLATSHSVLLRSCVLRASSRFQLG